MMPIISVVATEKRENCLKLLGNALYGRDIRASPWKMFKIWLEEREKPLSSDSVNVQTITVSPKLVLLPFKGKPSMCF